MEGCQRKKKKDTDISFDEDEKNFLKVEENFRDGEQVNHPDFGRGVVVSQDDNLITIAFPKFGVKKMAKGIAPLEKA
jgi:hypothetical protein